MLDISSAYLSRIKKETRDEKFPWILVKAWQTSFASFCLFVKKNAKSSIVSTSPNKQEIPNSSKFSSWTSPKAADTQQNFLHYTQGYKLVKYFKDRFEDDYTRGGGG